MFFNKRRIRALAIIGFVILGIIAFRIFDFLLPKTEEELLKEKYVDNQIIENSVLVISDGSINEDMVALKSDTFRYLFENDGYIYTEKIKQDGFLSSDTINPLLVYEESFGEYEYIIINGGFCDFLAQLEIGEFGIENTGLCETTTDFFDECSMKSPNTTYIIVGVPYFKDIEYFEGIDDMEYTVADYNFVLEMIANKYDNVYYLDFAETTYENPANISGNSYLYDTETLKVLYESFKKIEK